MCVYHSALQNRRVHCGHSILLLRVEAGYVCNKHGSQAPYYRRRSLSLQILIAVNVHSPIVLVYKTGKSSIGAFNQRIASLSKNKKR